MSKNKVLLCNISGSGWKNNQYLLRPLRAAFPTAIHAGMPEPQTVCCSLVSPSSVLSDIDLNLQNSVPGTISLPLEKTDKTLKQFSAMPGSAIIVGCDPVRLPGCQSRGTQWDLLPSKSRGLTCWACTILIAGYFPPRNVPPGSFRKDDVTHICHVISCAESYNGVNKNMYLLPHTASDIVLTVCLQNTGGPLYLRESCSPLMNTETMVKGATACVAALCALPHVSISVPLFYVEAIVALLFLT